MSCTRTITLACIFFGTLVNAILYPFWKLKTVQAIWMKLHTVLEHNETMCHVQEFITLLCIFLELFPFDHLQCYFVSALQVENRYSYLHETSYSC